MKRVLLVISAIALFLITEQANAQCNAELYISRAMRELSQGFQFSKSYRIDFRGGTRKKIEYTCVFSKDTNYQIHIVSKDGNAYGLIGTLYDSRRNRIVTSYYNNKFMSSWTYKCRSTGIYYLSFTYKDSKSYCGAAVLGFSR